MEIVLNVFLPAGVGRTEEELSRILNSAGEKVMESGAISVSCRMTTAEHLIKGQRGWRPSAFFMRQHWPTTATKQPAERKDLIKECLEKGERPGLQVIVTPFRTTPEINYEEALRSVPYLKDSDIREYDLSKEGRVFGKEREVANGCQ